MDGVHREVCAKMRDIRANLVGEDGSLWELCQVLFADDTALVADSEGKLQKLVEGFDRVCVRRKLKINVNKS